MQCDNASSGVCRIVSPRCWDSLATWQVAVIYNEVEKDSLFLCDDCAKAVTRDARKHGYKVQKRKYVDERSTAYNRAK